VFNQCGDVECSALRPRNVHSTDGWRVVLEPVIARYRGLPSAPTSGVMRLFANREIYGFLEAEHIGYMIRPTASCSVGPAIY